MSANAGLLLPWTAQGALRAVREVLDVEMDRRLFLTLVGAAAAQAGHEWLVAPAVDNLDCGSVRDLPVGVVDQLDALTAGLRRMDDDLGSGRLLRLVLAHARTAAGLIEERRYSESTGRRLHSAEGELLRLAGWLAFDDGHHAQAQRYWTSALHAAHVAGDRALGANILGFMACQAKDIGSPRQAVTLAETARAGYPGATPRIQAILDLRAAEAYAIEGDAGHCQAAIDAAFNRLDQTPPESGEPEWCYWLNVTHAHGQAGYCHIKLGQWAEARSHLRTALRVQGDTPGREGALRQTLLATTYVHQQHPDLDRAVDLGTRAMETLTGQVTSTRCVGHVNRLVNDLARYQRTPAVREFLDHANTVLVGA